MYVDFHIHTNYSDGGKSFTQILDECIQKNIKCISITDHNTYESCKLKIQQEKVKIINGMEIDVKYKEYLFHMLLYNFDLNSKLLKEFYVKNRKHEIYNFNKNINILKKKYNITIDKNIKRKFIKENNYFDRVRLNNLLVKSGYCKTPQDAFHKYTKELDNTKRMSISMETLFKIASDSNAIVSFAHPFRYGISMDEIERVILELKEKYGLRVIEAINNRQTVHQEKNLIKFCEENDLLISAGSDSHYKLGMTPTEFVGSVHGKKICERNITFLKLLKK